ncbi:MAG: hypothetical protein ACR2O6_01515 [Ilumatobacteraceae bacterium]
MATAFRSFEEVDSRELHHELRNLDRAAIVRAQGYWFALIVVGAITMFSPEKGGMYWLITVPLGTAVIVRRYRRRALPVAASSAWYPMVTLWLLGGTNVVADLSTSRTAQVVTYTLIGVGFLVLASVERSWTLAGTALATPLLAGLIAMVGSTEPKAYPMTIGFTWFFVGLVVWLYRE